MAKLNKAERDELYTNISKRYDEVQHILNLKGMCSKYADAMMPQEIMFRKFRIAYCLKELEKFGLMERMYNFNFLDIEDLFYTYQCNDDLYEDEEEEYPYFIQEIIEVFNEFGDYYLRNLLAQTNWNIDYVIHITDYEKFPKEIIESMKDLIEVHWYCMEKANEIYFSDEMIEVESDYLQSLGLKPEDYYELYPTVNVVATNNIVQQVIDICNKNQVYQEWDEFKEFSRYRNFILFDRYFPDLCTADISDNNWNYLNYYLGEIYMSDKEETGFYQLNYEAVVYMILADMAAEQFMNRYNKQNISMDGAA